MLINGSETPVFDLMVFTGCHECEMSLKTAVLEMEDSQVICTFGVFYGSCGA